jgi:hypothetical protein
MWTDLARADVIAEGKRALPGIGHDRALYGSENRLGILGADGDGGNMGFVALRGDAS